MTYICTVLVEKNVDDMIRAANNTKGSDIVELRLDCLQDLSKESVDRLIKGINSNKIATVRKKEEGGTFEGKEDERISYLMQAIASGANYIDVELSTDLGWRYELVKKAKAKNCKVIISYYNLNETPSEDFLDGKIMDSFASGASIVKIETTAKGADDAIRMINVVKKYTSQGKSMIGIVTGNDGKLTRVPWDALGNEITYVSLNNSDNGQFTLDKAVELKKLLNG